MEVRGWAEGLSKRGRVRSGVLHRLEFWHGTGTTTVTCQPSIPFAAEIVSDPKESRLEACASCRRIAAAEARRVAAAKLRQAA